MCGIVAYSGEDNFNPDKIKLLMLWNATERGKDSTGIFTPSLGVVKNITEAKVFLNKMDFEPEKQFMGHVRSKTSGYNILKNAHPFDFDHLVGIHNGTLDNIWSILPEFELSSANYNVDSEALFAILNKTLEPKNIAKIIGSMALVWHYKKTGNLYIYRNDERPLYYGFIDKGVYISSIKESLEMISCTKIEEFKEEELYKIEGSNVISCDIKIKKAVKPIPVINVPKTVPIQSFKGYWGRFTNKFVKIYKEAYYRGAIDLDILDEDFVLFKYNGLEHENYLYSAHMITIFKNGKLLGDFFVDNTIITQNCFFNKSTTNVYYWGVFTEELLLENENLLDDYHHYLKGSIAWIGQFKSSSDNTFFCKPEKMVTSIFYHCLEPNLVIPLCGANVNRKVDEKLLFLNYFKDFDFSKYNTTTTKLKIVNNEKEEEEASNIFFHNASYGYSEREKNIEKYNSVEAADDEDNTEELEYHIPESQVLEFREDLNDKMSTFLHKSYVDAKNDLDLFDINEQMMLTIDELLFDYFEAFKEQWETEEVNNTEKVLDKEEHAN